MKYIIILLSIFLVSCGSFELNSESIEWAYTSENKTLNLQDKNIEGFVYLNKYKPEAEVADIMIYNNSIEVIDVSWYEQLDLLNVSNNKLNYFSDLKLPDNILHLNVAGNNLSTLDGINKLQQLKTLDLRNNRLTSNELKKLSGMDNLKVILVDWNPEIDQETANDFRNFSLKYISRIKNPQDLDVNKHSYLK